MRIPSSTYRLQLRSDFGFDRAAALTDYLADLGVSHVYCSPYLQAEPGSTHGYDVADPRVVNVELGGEEGLRHFRNRLSEAHLGQVLDIVPNHMATDPQRNEWWRDVLAEGPESRVAHFFDIDWPALAEKVLVPILGRELTDAVRAGEVTARHVSGQQVVTYYDHELPLSPSSAVPDAADAGELMETLAQQHYILAFWRRGLRDLNYRRFFDIPTLVGIRVEDQGVFAATHERIAGWLREGALDGVRVDHPDGLADPEGYFERLHAISPDAWVVAEKILEHDEQLPPWAVAGTTGYDFLNDVTRLLVDSSSERELTDLYADFTGETTDYSELVREKKLLVMQALLVPEIERLTRLAAERTATTHEETRAVLRQVIASLPVYRTYIRRAEPVSDRDRVYVEKAIADARAHQPGITGDGFDAIRSLLLADPETRDDAFVTRFQQTTGAVMAKGVEDTAFYCYNRFVALNDVGGDPSIFGSTVDEFHDAIESRSRWPHAMLASSTHDTKRSEDVRARLAVLSEIPAHWRAAVEEWSGLNERHRTGSLPDRNAEYLLYQVLVGAHPLSSERAVEYMRKAAREAKQHTSWLDVDASYEDALTRFVVATVEDRDFQASLDRFVQQIADAGWTNSLAQKLLTLTAPGVPDIYQGSELWDLSLVDPDNRRPVDYELRRRLLQQVREMSPDEAWSRRAEGLPKLLLVQRTLQLRQRHREVFERFDYEPCFAAGPKRHHLVAFCRSRRVIALATRLPFSLGGWEDTTVSIPDGTWTDVLTGKRLENGTVHVGELLDPLPVALLEWQGAA